MTRGSYASVHWLKIFLCFLYGFISDGVAAAAAPLMCAYLHTMGNIITRFGGIFAWRQPHAPVPRHPGTLYSSYFVGWRRRLSVVSRRVLLRITLAPTLIGMTSTCPPPFRSTAPPWLCWVRASAIAARPYLPSLAGLSGCTIALRSCSYVVCRPTTANT